MMRSYVKKAVRALAFLAGVWATSLAAQPSETPPEDAGGTYVDRTGCAWQRVDIDGQVAWAALMGSEGAQLCGLTPSRSDVPEEDAALASGPASETSQAEPKNPAPAKPRAPKRPNFPTNGYYLQIGAFEKDENAQRAIGFLQSQSFGALQAKYRGRMPLQIVYAGPFATAPEAEAARRAARQAGYRDAFVWVPRQ